MDDESTVIDGTRWLRAKRQFTDAFAGELLAMEEVRAGRGREWLQQSRRQAYRYILAFIAALLVPIIAHNLYIGEPIPASLISALLAFLLFDISLLSTDRDLILSPPVLMAVLAGLDLLLLYSGHRYALFLQFPLLIALPVLLPGRMSLALCVATLLLSAPAAFNILPSSDILLVGFALGLCWFISNWLVYVLAVQTKRLRDIAVTDPLTGAYNRRYMELRAYKGLEAWARYGREETLLVMDVDRFKAINDKFGHSVGDRALAELVCVVQSRVRSADTLCRFGGEEFVLLLSETDAQHALAVAEKLREAVAAAQILPEGQQMTVSIGVCHVGAARNVDHWFQLADRALYAAKSKGRNRVELARGRQGA